MQARDLSLGAASSLILAKPYFSPILARLSFPRTKSALRTLSNTQRSMPASALRARRRSVGPEKSGGLMVVIDVT